MSKTLSFVSPPVLGVSLALVMLPGMTARAQSPQPTAASESTEDPVAEVVITEQQELPEGSVESGYRNRTGSLGPLGNTTLRETPFSLNVTSGELIENSNAHTVGDALKTNPTVTSIMSSNGYSSMSRVMSRGFSASDQNEQRDGLPDRSFTWVPLENVERIEVFNGLNGFLTGFGSPGGTVNYVSKKPTDTALQNVSAGVYNGGVGFVHADIGGRIATDDKFGYRLNLYHEDGNTYTDGSTQERTLLSGYFDLRLAPDTKLWTDVWHQNYHATGLTPYIAPANWETQGVPDASKFDPTQQYGQDWTYNKSEKTQVGVGLDTKLNETFSARLGARHAYMWRDTAWVTDIVQADGETYNQYYTRSARQREVVNSGYAMLDAKFDTYGIQHKTTAGYNHTSYYFSRGWDVSNSPGSGSLLLGTSSISSPSSFADPNLSAGGKTRYNPVQWDNFLLGDVATLNDQWSVLAGITHARYHFELNDWGVTQASSTTYNKGRTTKQSANTPSFGVMYKPVPSVTTYGSYMQLLESGGTAPNTTANAGQVMDPNISHQYEIGVKSTIGGLDLNTALFRIEKANEYTDPSDNMYKQDGLEIHQGIEVTGTGKLTDDLTFVGGFTWMDAHVAEAKAAPLTEGKTPINVPELQARAYLEYGLPFLDNLTLTGGANYYGRRPVTATNSKYIPEAITVDLGLRYQPEIYGHDVSMNLGVANLFDTSYWAYWYSSGEGMMLGAPRTVSFSVKTSW